MSVLANKSRALDDRPAPRERRGVVDPSQPSAEPFRSLRLALELRDNHRQGNVVVFTSANPGEGKSTIAANYAIVAAINHPSVLLIDGDLRRPSLHELFGAPRGPGLVDVIVGDAPANVAHRVSGIGNLDLLTAGGHVMSGGDFMSSRRVHDFIESASKHHDLVVIDTPPILSAADAATIATSVGADVVLVVDRSSRRRAVARALRELELVRANVLGLVVNREGTLARYGYGYGYGS
jgi:capsular exopolysaccharide synthesis family protein